MTLFPRLRRARDDAEFWKRSHASAVDIINNRRARMKHMAAENARLRIKVAELYEEVAVLRYGVDRFVAVTEKLLGVQPEADLPEGGPVHAGCPHPMWAHGTWGCTLTGCRCQFTPWSIEGRPSKVTPADDTVVMATVGVPIWDLEGAYEKWDETAVLPVVEWTAEEEAASFLADDDAQRRRADR